MKKITVSILSMIFLGISGMQQVVAQEYPPLEMGVNVNERPHWLKSDLLEQSQTRWVRAFIESSHYIKGERSLDDDFRIEALKRVAADGYKVLLSIKWNLKEASWSIPEPGSKQEEQWFHFAGDLLQELQGDLSMLVLVNELVIDTPEEDLQPDENDVIPFVQFQKRLLDFVSKRNPRATDGKPLPIYTGGFTRLDKKELQNHPAYRAMFNWINEDNRLTGASFHMHQSDYLTTVEAAYFIREQIPDKPLIVPEFSLIWKWKAHLGDEIGKTKPGLSFAEHYGLNPGMTVAEYSTKAFNEPVSETEWQDFLKSQPWYEPDYLNIMGRLMETRGVVVATYAFTQNPETSRSRKITENSTPWFVHQIFMPMIAYSPDEDRTAVNYGMFNNFIRWQKATKIIQSSVGKRK